MRTSFILLLALGLLCLAAAKPHNEGKRTHLTKRSREHKLTNRMEHGEHHRREHGPAHKPEQHRPEAGRKKEVAAHDAVHRPQPRRTTSEGGVHKAALHRGANTGGGARGAPTQHDLKKDLHLQHITEHNIEKKHEDKQQRREEPLGKHLITNRVPRGGDTTAPHLLTNRTPLVASSTNTTDLKAGGKGRNGTKDDIPMESERLIHVTARPPKVHRVNKMHHKPSPASAAASAPSSQAQGSTPSTKAKAHKPPKKYSPKKHGWKKSLRKEKAKDKLKEKRERREKRFKALHRAQIAKKL